VKARWILNNPSPKPPLMGYTIVAHWLPWKYYLISTVEIWGDESDPMYQLMKKSFDAPKKCFVTQVFKCNRIGWTKDMNYFYYQKEYSHLSEAEYGHKEIVELLSKGKLRLERQSYYK